MTDSNIEIAALLLDLAEVYRPSARFWGYKNAARSIRRHPEFLSDLSDKEILKIPGVGPASLRIAREYLDTGGSPTVQRIVSESEKAKEIAARQALRRNFLSAAMVQKVLAEPRRGAILRTDYGGDFQMHSRGSAVRHYRAAQMVHKTRLLMHVRTDLLRSADCGRHDAKESRAQIPRFMRS